VRTIHEAVYAVTEELKRNLIYDDYRKGMFLEHFIGKEIGYEQFRSGDYDEEGDFLEGNYAYRVHEIPNSAHITLERKGSLREKYFSVRKEFSWDKKKHAIIVTYVLTNGKDEIKKIKFGTEFNFIMPAANAHECRYSSKGISIAHAGMESHGVVKDAKEYGVRDTLNKVRLDFSFDRKTGVWRYPFYSVSKSERSYELNYQGSTLMFWWDMDFKPREEKKRVLILSVR